MQVTCHCENVTIEVEKPQQITECNCSICSSYMSLWGYYAIGEPTINIAEFGTESYAWGDQGIDFIRCKTCGCVTHYQTKAGQSDPRIAINFRLAQALVADVPVRYFDGANQ